MGKFLRAACLALGTAVVFLSAPLFADTTISSPTTYAIPFENASGENFTVADTGALANTSSFMNDAGGQVDNAGTLSNADDFYNYGSYINEIAAFTTNNKIFLNAAGASLSNTAGGTITNDFFFDNVGFLDNTGTLSNAAGAEVYDYGGLVNESAGLIANNGTLYNEGGSSLTNTAGGAITNSGAFYNESFLANAGTLSNTADAAFYDDGGLVNESAGILANNGDFYNDSGASLTNTAGGSMGNNGNFYNYSGAYLANMAGGGITNNAYLENDGFLDNAGALSNTAGGNLTNSGDFENGGFLDNAGTLSNTAGAEAYNLGGLVNESAGVITNNGDFYNDREGTLVALTNSAGGTIINNASFGNVGFLDNAGALVNATGATFDNSGGFVNGGAGTITNNGSFYNYSFDPLTNTAGGTIVNDAYFENDSFLDNGGALANNGGFLNFMGASLTNTAGGAIVNSGGFENDGFLDNAGLITNNGSLYNGNGGSLTNAVGGTLANNDDVQNYGFLDNEGTLTSTASATFSNDGGLVNGGAGIIVNNGAFYNAASLTNTAGGTITNNDSFVNGAFIDNEGTIDNEGAAQLGLISFFNDGTIDNAGTFTNAAGAGFTNADGVLINAGTFSGGSLINEDGGTVVNRGSMALSGDFTQDAASSLVLEVSPKTASGLTVGGSASLAGTLKVVYAPGVYMDRSYTLLSANSISGAFNTVEQSSPYATGTLEYLPDPSVVLEVTSLEVSPDNDSVFAALGNLALEGAQRSEEGLLRRLDGLDLEGKTGAWEDNTGYSYHMDGAGPVTGYEAQGGGLAAGMDRRWGRIVGGFAFADGATGVRLADGENGSVADPGANLYGGLGLGPVDLKAALGYAYEDFSAARPIAALGQTASSSYGGQEASGTLRAGLPLEEMGLSVHPTVGLDYARVESGGFTENGAEDFNLAVAGHTVQELAPSVGLSIEKGFTVGSWSLRPSLEGGLSYETLDQDLAGTASVGGTSFALEALTPASGILTLGGGLEAKVAGSFSLVASYRAALPMGNAFAQSLSMGLSYVFGE